jgi:hypothetical protein
MSVESRLIAVTTIQYGVRPDANQMVRSGIFLDTAERLRALNIPCLATAGPCPKGYIRKVQVRGVVISRQKIPGMGNARREALLTGSERFPSATHYLWLEPEKPDMPEHAICLWHQMQAENTALGLFNRKSMASYPSEQAHYYLFCRVVASSLLGFDLDYAFGPMILTRASLPYFLNYRGEYGDLWDSILIPRLRTMNAGLGFSIQETDFKNDLRMKNVESGNPRFILKRIDQFNNVVRSLVAEWQKMNP